MKHLIASAAILIILTGSAAATYQADTDYMAVMMEVAASGDIDDGIAAAEARNKKIDDLELSYQKIDFMELYLLSKIIHAEAGSYWLSDYHQLGVGNVLLNRIASPEFPDTLEECLYQTGQYYGEHSSYFNNLLPSERAVYNALELLEGKRVFPPSVVFQSNYILGSGIYVEIDDPLLGSTYFCYSSYPELYTEGG